MHAHTSTRTHPHTHTHTSTRTHPHAHILMHTSTHIHPHTHILMDTSTRTHPHAHTHPPMFTCGCQGSRSGSCAVAGVKRIRTLSMVIQSAVAEYTKEDWRTHSIDCTARPPQSSLSPVLKRVHVRSLHQALIGLPRTSTNVVHIKAIDPIPLTAKAGVCVCGCGCGCVCDTRPEGMNSSHASADILPASINCHLAFLPVCLIVIIC